MTKSRSKTNPVPPEYVGERIFDPQVWIDRLIEVNAASQFAVPQRMKIHDAFLALKRELAK